MYKKLTLRINDNIIEKAKNYANDSNQSLSKLVENFFNNLTSFKSKTLKSDTQIEISPNIKELTGILNINNNQNYKKQYQRHLEEKYL